MICSRGGGGAGGGGFRRFLVWGFKGLGKFRIWGFFRGWEGAWFGTARLKIGLAGLGRFGGLVALP